MKRGLLAGLWTEASAGLGWKLARATYEGVETAGVLAMDLKQVNTQAAKTSRLRGISGVGANHADFLSSFTSLRASRIRS
jgi:hypothetical protein